MILYMVISPFAECQCDTIVHNVSLLNDCDQLNKIDSLTILILIQYHGFNFSFLPTSHIELYGMYWYRALEEVGEGSNLLILYADSKLGRIENS